MTAMSPFALARDLAAAQRMIAVQAEEIARLRARLERRLGSGTDDAAMSRAHAAILAALRAAGGKRVRRDELAAAASISFCSVPVLVSSLRQILPRHLCIPFARADGSGYQLVERK